ncbi:hypothetical protein D6D17_06497 [Aureobasidium pullulans]|nr:hypothetical protein D6D17_06497 [Aureobasidium pullulans]
MSLFKKSILPLSPHTISIHRHLSARSIGSMASEASKQVHRITMFKIPDPSNIQPILDKYSTMAQDAKKLAHGSDIDFSTQDGKPYILRCVAGPAVNDARSQGYTLAAQTTFSSLDDMKYYDNDCEAHAALKAVAKGKVEPPPLMVCFDNAVGTFS